MDARRKHAHVEKIVIKGYYYLSFRNESRIVKMYDFSVIPLSFWE